MPRISENSKGSKASLFYTYFLKSNEGLGYPNWASWCALNILSYVRQKDVRLDRGAWITTRQKKYKSFISLRQVLTIQYSLWDGSAGPSVLHYCPPCAVCYELFIYGPNSRPQTTTEVVEIRRKYWSNIRSMTGAKWRAITDPYVVAAARRRPGGGGGALCSDIVFARLLHCHASEISPQNACIIHTGGERGSQNAPVREVFCRQSPNQLEFQMTQPRLNRPYVTQQ